jgi:hypothetical protein
VAAVFIGAPAGLHGSGASEVDGPEKMGRTTTSDVALLDEYDSTLQALKERVRGARQRAQRTVNTQMIELYWHLGHEILVRRERQGWRTGAMKRLADDLRAEFPDMTGLSRSNL